MLIESHLSQISTKLEALSDDKIITFGTLCLSRQWNLFPHYKRSDYYTLYLNHLLAPITQTLKSVQESIDVSIDMSSISSRFDEIFENGVDDSEDGIILFTVIQTTFDFFVALNNKEINYLKEYPHYRNIDLILTHEEHVYGDVKDAFSDKPASIAQLLNDEMTRQLSNINVLETIETPTDLLPLFAQNRNLNVLNI